MRFIPPWTYKYLTGNCYHRQEIPPLPLTGRMGDGFNIAAKGVSAKQRGMVNTKKKAAIVLIYHNTLKWFVKIQWDQFLVHIKFSDGRSYTNNFNCQKRAYKNKNGLTNYGHANKESKRSLYHCRSCNAAPLVVCNNEMRSFRRSPKICSG